ncbi:MAG: SHOCT domain-containing protein [Ruminococcaceae bacterium]|nr:SHOCT domain-containing protein [Oscillospiraceae bacterium]
MTVLDAVKLSKSTTLMQGQSIKAAQELLMPTEKILSAIIANVNNSRVKGMLTVEPTNTSDKTRGVVVITDQRVLFVHSLLGHRTKKEILVSDIRSIDSKASLGFECLRIKGITEMIVVTDTSQCIACLKNALDAILIKGDDPALANSATVSSAVDVSQLQTLKQLYDDGVITAEEFAAKKAQILGL